MTVLKSSAAIQPEKNLALFGQGMRDCIVIAAGYFVVSFTLGIAMRNAGMTPLQGFFCALLNNASAGEYAGITMIASGAAYGETAVMTLIANARYLLMSCSLSQKVDQHTSVGQRMLLSFDVTDELFGLAISQKGYLNPWYYYGAVALALPAWAGGTVLGILMGNIMSASLISAFSVSLYAMFLAIIIPEGKKNKVVGVLIVISFFLSYAGSILPGVKEIPDGFRTIFLTIILSSATAALFPHREEECKNDK